VRELIVARKLSPVEVVEAALRRIGELDGRLHAFITVTDGLAMQQARDAERAVIRGDELGPLHGVPVSIKDLEGVKGVRQTNGSLLHSEDVSGRDALCVERLRSAGAIIIGKTNTPEYGAAGTTENRLGAPTANPWDLSRTAGGSSGGAAASVAAGITAFAQGSDGGGSVRIPASFCGIFGIKATQGRVPRRSSGVHSFHPLNNSSVGPLSRDVRDSAVALTVLSGPALDAEAGTIDTPPPDFTKALGRGVKGLRIAWSPDFGGVAVDHEVVEVCERAAKLFEEMGADVDRSDFKPDAPEAVFDAFVTYAAAKSYAMNKTALERKDQLTDYFLAALERGRQVTGEEMFLAVSRLGKYQSYTSEFFRKFDLLLSPTLAVPAFKIGELPDVIGGKRVFSTRLGFYPFTYPFNATGNPAASVPCGFAQTGKNSEGLPVGLQVVARHGDEQTMFAAAAAFEQARPWAHRRPPVS
jgi:aspartyl-tRNA(Asn)/glutamyl-tRNA(Gln) amidotransferase subunit A